MPLPQASTSVHLLTTLTLIFTIAIGPHLPIAHGYHRSPCKSSSVRRQFQFSECYVPNMNPDLYLTQASFLMAHDAATGYLNAKVSGINRTNANDSTSQNNNGLKNTVTTRLLSLYGKTQVGSVYDQLNDGARALDLRPKLYNNGTIGFHHGSLIDIPLTSVNLEGLLEDAKKWCSENPKELVIIFHSELVHEAGQNGLSSQVYAKTTDDANNDDANAGNDDDAQENYAYYNDQQEQYEYENDDVQHAYDGYDYFYTGIAELKKVYKDAGVPYYSCNEMSGLTVEEAMDMADLSKSGGKGYLLAVDRHDMYGESEQRIVHLMDRY
jgi:hypothetical protein